MYSFSPTGSLQKFSRANAENVVIQVDPVLDCSGYAVYVSQTQMKEKFSYGVDELAHVSAVQPKSALFTLMVPATGSIYWSESYPCMHIIFERITMRFQQENVITKKVPITYKQYELVVIACYSPIARLFGDYIPFFGNIIVILPLSFLV